MNPDSIMSSEKRSDEGSDEPDSVMSSQKRSDEGSDEPQRQIPRDARDEAQGVYDARDERRQFTLLGMRRRYVAMLG